MADNLKLMALDADDLLVLSAHVQDSVLLSSEIEFDPNKGLLFLPINRFAWEAPSARRLFFKKYQRRRSVLHFSKIKSLKSSGVDRCNPSCRLPFRHRRKRTIQAGKSSWTLPAVAGFFWMSNVSKLN